MFHSRRWLPSHFVPRCNHQSNYFSLRIFPFFWCGFFHDISDFFFSLGVECLFYFGVLLLLLKGLFFPAESRVYIYNCIRQILLSSIYVSLILIRRLVDGLMLCCKWLFFLIAFCLWTYDYQKICFRRKKEGHAVSFFMK